MLASIQQQFIAYWKRQSLAKQISVVSLVLAALILTPVLVNWANTPSYAVVYTGLSEADAAQIVQKLDENNIPYQLKSSGTIEVPNDQVYSTRLMMASAGLPQTNTVGYELFSGSSTFGMTEFSQKVNYQRAVEGELQRTIGSLEAVKAVRVHLVTPEKTLLSSDQTLSTASVTIQVKPGYTLSAAQVQSITHLVASSVEGLKSENVVVIDSDGNMLADGAGNQGQTNISARDDQRSVEQAYSAEVQKRVQSLLNKILGPNNSIVQVAVEMDWTQREITSNTFSPTEVAVRSSQKIAESSNGGATTGGVPGAASNLPTPVATAAGTSASSYQRNEETLNFEVSQVQSHEIIAPGKVKRMSVSVMVDGITEKAQLDSIKAAVQAAAGIDTTRGDAVVVETFAFDRTAMDALTADLEAQQQRELYMQIGLGVGAGAIVLALLFFILRMINGMRNASKDTWTTILRPTGEMTPQLQGAQAQGGLPQPGGSIPASLGATAMGASALAAKAEIEDVVVQLSPRVQAATAPEDEQRARIISRLAEENPATVAEIIQIWLNEGKR